MKHSYHLSILAILLFGSSTVLMAQVDLTSSNLPIIIINTSGNAEITQDFRVDATMKIVYDSLGGRNSITGPFSNYDGKIAIKGRGSSSWEAYPKKGYSFETRTELDSNNNVSLLGMPIENDWVLHGPYGDKTLMKNAFVYTIGSELGRYTPRTKFCELVLNDTYAGVYLLVEKVKRDKNRLDIATLNPDEISGDDLTGGYIVSIDRADEGAWPTLVDFNGQFSQYNYIYPEPKDDMPYEQKEYIKNYLRNFEQALYSGSLSDSNNGYRAYIDLPSFIDFFIINEWTKNIDAYRLSTYLYKDKDSKGGKLTMGPLWDFNLSCGGVNIGYGNWGATAENWIYQEYNGQPFWWQKFLNDPYYNACLKKRWFELRESTLNEAHINAIIDDYKILLDEAKTRNFQIHPLEEAVWGNDHSGFTYDQEIDTLKGFLKERMKWMDREIGLISDYIECNECFTCGPEPTIVTDLSPALKKEQIVSVYPNPFDNIIQFQINGQKNTHIKIYNLSGIEVYPGVTRSDQTLSVDMSKISGSGLYLYTIIADGEVIEQGKIIRK